MKKVKTSLIIIFLVVIVLFGIIFNNTIVNKISEKIGAIDSGDVIYRIGPSLLRKINESYGGYVYFFSDNITYVIPAHDDLVKKRIDILYNLEGEEANSVDIKDCDTKFKMTYYTISVGKNNNIITIYECNHGNFYLNTITAKYTWGYEVNTFKINIEVNTLKDIDLNHEKNIGTIKTSVIDCDTLEPWKFSNMVLYNSSSDDYPIFGHWLTLNNTSLVGKRIGLLPGNYSILISAQWPPYNSYTSTEYLMPINILPQKNKEIVLCFDNTTKELKIV